MSGLDGPGSQLPATTDQDSRNQATFAHLSALAGWLIPFGHIIGPLAFWLAKRDDHPWVAEHARRALNFQLSVTLWAICCVPLIFVLVGFFLLAALGLVSLACTVIGAIKAHDGNQFRYPLSIQFVSARVA